MSGSQAKCPSSELERLTNLFHSEVALAFSTERGRNKARRALETALGMVERGHDTLGYRVGYRGYLLDTELQCVSACTPLYQTYDTCYDFLHRIRDMKECVDPHERFYIKVISVHCHIDEPTEADILDDMFIPDKADAEQVSEKRNYALADIVDILQSHEIIPRNTPGA